jgi:hypothetical protein
MNRTSSFVALLVLGACSPQNAELTSGSFTMFVSNNTSAVSVQDTIDFSKFENTWTIDCRSLETEDFRLEDRLDICNGYGDFTGSRESTDSGPDGVPNTDDDEYDYDSVVHEGWINLDGFKVAHEALEPWRGEAIMTSEGDLQFTFHHRLNGGNDMRFAMVVDPKFTPRTCEQDGEGVKWEPIDGDWVSQWSEQLGSDSFPGSGSSGTLFALNSGAYQFNPTPTEDSEPWYFPDEWSAGFAQARWGPEVMFMRTTRYGLPASYANFEQSEVNLNEETDLFFVNVPEGTAGSESSAYADEMARVQAVADETQAEMELMFPEGTTAPNFKPVAINNGWRVSDGRNAGLDGWGELHYNWIRVDQAADQLELGAEVSGEFQLVFKGVDSGSRLFVQGEFTVDKIKKDHWTVKELAPQKYAENETVLCGENAYASEE